MSERFRPTGLEFAAQSPKDPREQTKPTPPPVPIQQIVRRQMRRTHQSGK